MPCVSLRALRTRFPGPGCLSKKTTAILRPKASSSRLLSSRPAKVLCSAMYRNEAGVQETWYMKPFAKTALM